MAQGVHAIQDNDSAFSLFGISKPVKAGKATNTASGTRYRVGYRDLINNPIKEDVSLKDFVKDADKKFTAESMARTLRCYIAYKIGHRLVEVGVSPINITFTNRINSRVSVLSSVLPEDHVKIVEFYKVCMKGITDHWDTFINSKNGKRYLVALNGTNVHVIEFAVSESEKTESGKIAETPESEDAEYSI